MMTPLELLIEKLKLEEESAYKQNNFNAEDAFAKAIKIAEDLLKYENLVLLIRKITKQ